MRGRAVGIEIKCPTNAQKFLNDYNEKGYRFASIPLVHPASKHCYSANSSPLDRLAATRPEVAFVKKDNCCIDICGIISIWIDVDSISIHHRKLSEEALEAELSYAAYLGIPAVRIRLLRNDNPNLARLLSTFLLRERNPFEIWIDLPVSAPVTPFHQSATEFTFDPWKAWTTLMTMCRHCMILIKVLLDIPEDLPDHDFVLCRWFSEPIAALRIDTNLFVTNTRNWPVLSTKHKLLVQRFFKLKVEIMISGRCRHSSGFSAYFQYIAFIYSKRTPDSVYIKHSTDAEDVLQDPLQPLADHLTAGVYSVFELDPYKYNAYEEAAYQCITDKMNNENDRFVIMILGAGRGPLVDCCLKACGRAGVKFRLYVVEKNPNALVTLKYRLATEWKDNDIHLIGGDMRTYDFTEKADIFMSELLGSFSDNELSPECLDGALKHLKPDGVSIPTSYTSYLAPVQSWKNYININQMLDYDRPKHTAYETPYVVHLCNYMSIAAPVEVFTFQHPSTDNDRSRFGTFRFIAEEEHTLHGFAGYFSSVLYKDVTLSTHPETHSPNMFSWFPIFFPLSEPVNVKRHDRIVLNMWRVVGRASVWYEWSLSEPTVSHIHNCGGRSYKIGLT